ncbi:MAG: Chaperone protein DnaK [Planctomycetes bacterium ADurb.Bin126]|nr:MAG: Chaperone protein DnaK [Planctomycetes bacterium ADurb.Bin126]HOD81385.1 Hsp70 family protein [Phycisphaerae bacterium]HQL76286.1 Hsp70 family protein [Phycisphaerae bacterium]
MPDSNIILGIDLGTTNSLGAYMSPAGPVVIRDQAGNALVPSVLAFAPDGQVTVGSEARAHAVANPLATVYSVKRLMGKGIRDVQQDLKFLPYGVHEGPHGTVVVQVGQRRMTPQELSALILRDLRQRAEAALGQPITQAVITVPAYFDDAQRQATRDAGRIAGLEVKRIVNEPTAAALAYGLDLPAGQAGKKEDATIAVYDLGGGTFDVSILRVSGGVFQVLATNGDTHLGGDDLDLELIDLITSEIVERFFPQAREKFLTDVPPDLSPSDRSAAEMAFVRSFFPPATRQALRNFAEAAKIRLSEEASATVEIDLGEGRLYQRAITRDEFEARAGKWVDHTIEHCQLALADAGLTPDQIDQVVMVGGVTRMPLVRRRVGEFFGRTPYTAINPDEVVALGAAVQAGILAGQKRDTLLLDVTPLSLGIETLGGAVGKLIMRNSTVPCQAGETFSTYLDGQTNVDIHVLQGERELAKDCRSLGRFQLRGIPPMPAGAPRIQVTFLIDANGILNVSARELRSGREASVQITPAHGLTRDEVDRMVKESYTHAIEDLMVHRLIDTRNEAHRVLAAVDKALAQAAHVLSADQRAELDAAVADLKAKIDSDDADALYEAMGRANQAAMPLTQAQMDEVLKQTVKGRRVDEV